MTESVGRVMMCRDEIHGDMTRVAELEKLFNPSIARRCGPADFQ